MTRMGGVGPGGDIKDVSVGPRGELHTASRGHRFGAQESITVSTTATRLTQGTADGASQAFITIEGASLRFWLSDDANPTATVGHVLNPEDQLTLDGVEEIERARFIRKDGADATMRVSYGS
jgi:hypothetical protein